MVNFANYCTFNYGACTNLGRIYKILINVQNWSYIPCSTNKVLDKSGRLTRYDTQTGNLCETLSIKPKYFILSMYCMKCNCTCWHRGVKHTSSVTKVFWAIFSGITLDQKMYIIYVPSTQKIVPSHDVVFDEKKSSAL